MQPDRWPRRERCSRSAGRCRRARRASMRRELAASPASRGALLELGDRLWARSPAHAATPAQKSPTGRSSGRSAGQLDPGPRAGSHSRGPPHRPAAAPASSRSQSGQSGLMATVSAKPAGRAPPLRSRPPRPAGTGPDRAGRVAGRSPSTGASVTRGSRLSETPPRCARPPIASGSCSA